jgi:hypothetical protein
MVNVFSGHVNGTKGLVLALLASALELFIQSRNQEAGTLPRGNHRAGYAVIPHLGKAYI